MNEQTLRIIGIGSTILGLGATLVSGWVGEKTIDLTIENKIMEALAKIKE